jgi:hypothetical protein
MFTIQISPKNKDNDGDIQCFLKASSRYFGVGLDEEA